MLNEANIIAYLKSEFPKYIGDDSAVIKKDKTCNYVITKDLLVEDIHFRKKYCDPLSIAHKSIHVNLSDLAAMGSKAEFILLGISIPNSYSKYAKQLFEYFTKISKKCGVVLIGGDTTSSPNKLFISITAIGVAKTKAIKYRVGAKVGDLICVVGELGYAHLGLVALEGSFKGFKEFKEVFLKPKAKIEEGLWLAKQKAVHCMMDISDGLFIDLKRLCDASKTAAKLNIENLLFTRKFKLACKKLNIDPVKTILTGGEDYGLLFTINQKQYHKLSENFRRKFGYGLKVIGEIIEGAEVMLTENGLRKELELRPFSHFGESL